MKREQLRQSPSIKLLLSLDEKGRADAQWAESCVDGIGDFLDYAELGPDSFLNSLKEGQKGKHELLGTMRSWIERMLLRNFDLFTIITSINSVKRWLTVNGAAEDRDFDPLNRTLDVILRP